MNSYTVRFSTNEYLFDTTQVQGVIKEITGCTDAGAFDYASNIRLDQDRKSLRMNAKQLCRLIEMLVEIPYLSIQFVTYSASSCCTIYYEGEEGEEDE